MNERETQSNYCIYDTCNTCTIYMISYIYVLHVCVHTCTTCTRNNNDKKKYYSSDLILLTALRCKVNVCKTSYITNAHVHIYIHVYILLYNVRLTKKLEPPSMVVPSGTYKEIGGLTTRTHVPC